MPNTKTYFDVLPDDLISELSRHIIRHKLSESALNFLHFCPTESALSLIPERFKIKGNRDFSNFALNSFSGSIRRISLHSTEISLQNLLSALDSDDQTISADKLLECSPKFFRTREWTLNNSFYISNIRSMNLYLDSCNPQVVDQTLQLLQFLPLQFLELLCTSNVVQEGDTETCPLLCLSKDIPKLGHALESLDTLYLNGRSCTSCRTSAEDEQIQLYSHLLPLLPDIEEVGVRWNVSENELTELRKVERLSIARFYHGFETAIGLENRVVELRCRERILSREQLQSLQKCSALETLSVMVEWEDREVLIEMLPSFTELDDMYLEWIHFDDDEYDDEMDIPRDVMPRILRAGCNLQYFGVAGYVLEKEEINSLVLEGKNRLKYLKVHLQLDGIVETLLTLMLALRRYGRCLGELAVRCDFIAMTVKECELRNLQAALELLRCSLPQLGLSDIETIVKRFKLTIESDRSDVEMS